MPPARKADAGVGGALIPLGIGARREVESQLPPENFRRTFKKLANPIG